ncbi:unnamed protein product [Amaranthus hypochondriacus]
MKQNSMLKSPIKEETQLVPQNYYQGIESLEEIKGFLGLNNYEEKDENANKYCKFEKEENILVNNNFVEHEFFGWDFMNSSNWETREFFPINHENGDDSASHELKSSVTDNLVKNEEFENDIGFENENVTEETKTCLNLNLNYEEVLEAWSNRGSLWAHNHHSYSMSNNHYMGEVPSLEDERTRRESSVLRYKEKRQSRLFSKKIRYEVRKLNADKRPRLKGRFVKRSSEEV